MRKSEHVHLALLGSELSMPMITHMGTNYYRHAVKLEEHQHDGYEFVFVLKGEQTYELKDGRSIEVKGGQFSFMPPGIIHKGKGGFETPCQFCWMIFNPLSDRASRGTPFSNEELLEIKKSCSSLDTMVVDFNTNLRNTLHRFRMAFYEHHSAEGVDHSFPLLRSLACELMIDSLNQLKRTKAVKENAEKSFAIDIGKAAANYIEERVFESISVKDLANHLGYSTSRTYEIFKKYTGQSPIDYQLRLKIKAAQKQLINSGDSITTIANDSGFSSSQYFSRIFRQYLGKTPSEFRKINYEPSK